jgi:hypothetical protein
VTSSQEVPSTLSLNGTWEFAQTDNAFPPLSFGGNCRVPGLITLAEPKIDAYEKLFSRPLVSFTQEASDYTKIGYKPKYSWYRKSVVLGKQAEGTEVVLNIRKSMFVTQVFVNGYDMGWSVSCFTPIRMRITSALKEGSNEIFIRVGERIWLPPYAAGGTDKEKANYIPGIWDDVWLSFSGRQKIEDVIVLPSVKDKKAEAKVRIRSFYPQQMMYGDPMTDSTTLRVVVREKRSGKNVASGMAKVTTVRDNETITGITLEMEKHELWSPESPFLYEAEITLSDKGKISDRVVKQFGMRDFERRGKYFYLNGERYILRGTNITLHRFFEDPDCKALPWDRDWVKKMLIEDPKKIGWNAMRICVGLVPDFWYDLADEYGIMFQNEWMYWQNHGWDQQIREEYTDWVWSDGNHPSIVIWDAINENKNSFIGNVLIPELQALDPTRIWDAGYMVASDMKYDDQIDEPHPYRAGWSLMVAEDPAEFLKKNPYLLGKLDDWHGDQRNFLTAKAAQLVNEYGWNWLWRDGQPAKLTKKAYDLLVGEKASAEERRELQAYWLQCETEWLRAERSFAGVLAFTHLTNNYGFTGDWYTGNISELTPGPVFGWLRHAFAPSNVFIDLPDQRYFPNGFYEPGSILGFKLAAITDEPATVKGRVELTITDATGRMVYIEKLAVNIEPFGRTDIPVTVKLPSKKGGYLVKTEFFREGTNEVMMSRRYIRVGEDAVVNYPMVKPQ